MKLQFLELSPDERALYFQQAGAQRNVSPVLLEKDFWVSWLLGVLFNSEFGPSLVFKGGTSLSKVFRAIDRFSEDIDLSLSPQFLNLPPAGDTRNKANQWMRQAETACARAVEHQIMPALEECVRRFLGTKATPWFEYVRDPITHSPVLLFHYPTSQPDGFAYLKRSVKLEFGSLTDQQPAGRHAISPLITEILPSADLDWQCEVVALELERSFWEKATILHAEYHRPVERATPDRFSRHYADTAALALHPIADIALKDHALRDRVVAWKGQFFGSAWARYDLAAPGTFRLVPPNGRLRALRADYDAMSAMYMSEPMNFDSVLAALAELEARINLGASL
jgi:hypothetical protein